MAEPFKARLKNRRLLIGPLLTIPSTEIADIMADAEFDWLWIEMEHSPISLTEAQQMIQAVGNRCACLVRSPWNDGVWIKRILDIGCDGIIIPQIRSAAEAESAVRACRYPPDGDRSVGIARAQGFGMSLGPYVQRANQQLTIVLQVEHIDAVRRIDEIVAVQGIDAILIGPYDLSASMGLIGQVEHPDVQAAMTTIRDACQRGDMTIGAFAADEVAAKRHVDSGITLIALSTDALYLARAARNSLQQVRSTGPAPGPE